MQRNIPHGHHTPPIHHPVPQRPIQVPHMQSPPPPSHSSNPYDNPYGTPPYMSNPGAGGQGPYANHFTSFSNGAGAFFGDPMTAQMGFSMARAAMSGSSDVAEKTVSPMSLDSTDIKLIMSSLDHSLLLLPQTLLRRHQQLRSPETLHPPQPMAPPSVVSTNHRTSIGDTSRVSGNHVSPPE